MALTFGTENARINANLKNQFLHVGASSFNANNRFVFSNVGNSTYYTNFAIFSGARPTMTYADPGFNYSPTNNSNMLVYWQWRGDNGNWSTIAEDKTNSVKLSPNFFPSKVAYRAGEATWFALWTYYSSTVYGAVTGTVGAIGSGADLEITNTSIVTDGQTEYTVPYGIELYKPPILI